MSTAFLSGQAQQIAASAAAARSPGERSEGGPDWEVNEPGKGVAGVPIASRSEHDAARRAIWGKVPVVDLFEMLLIRLRSELERNEADAAYLRAQLNRAERALLQSQAEEDRLRARIEAERVK